MERQQLVVQIGNLVHDSVPVSDDEANNVTEWTFGDASQRKKYSHIDLVVMVDGVDMEKGTVAAGGRGYYLKGPLEALQDALIFLAKRMLDEKDYTRLYTPFFMRKEVSPSTAVPVVSLLTDSSLVLGDARGRTAEPVRRGALQGGIEE